MPIREIPTLRRAKFHFFLYFASKLKRDVTPFFWNVNEYDIRKISRCDFKLILDF